MAGVYDFDEDDIQPFPSKRSSKTGSHISRSAKNAEQITARRKHQRRKSSERKTTAKKIDNRSGSQSILKSSECSLSYGITMTQLLGPSSKSEVMEDLVKIEDCNLEVLSVSPHAKDEKLSRVRFPGEGLWCNEDMVQMNSIEFTFMTDSITLKLLDDQNVTTVVWPLDKIDGFDFRTCKQTNDIVLELNLTASGMMLLEQKFQSLICKYDFVRDRGSSLTTKINSSYLSDQARKITSLCDCYKRLWKHGNRHKEMSLQQDLQEPSNSDTHNIVGNGEIDGRVITKGLEVDMAPWFDLTYPKGDPDAVLVTMDDFLLLNPHEFVSDTVIDFYIKYLQSRLSEGEKDRCHFFNSFFFRKLTNLDRDPVYELEKMSSLFEQIKRWTRDINIFTKDFLFVPIIERCHWSLAIVCYPNHLFSDEHQKRHTGTTILHFDSMEGFHKGVEEKIEKYLVQHWCHIYSTNRSRNDKSCNVKCIRAKVPQQTNYSDCGLFMLHYVEMFLLALQNGLSKISVSRTWFNPEDVGSKRSLLQRLIRQMQEEERGKISARKHVDTCMYDADLIQDGSVVFSKKEPEEVCPGTDELRHTEAVHSYHLQPVDLASHKAVCGKVAQTASNNQLCKAVDACHSDASIRTFNMESSSSSLMENNLPCCLNPGKDRRQMINESHNQSEELNKMHEVEGFTTSADVESSSSSLTENILPSCLSLGKDRRQMINKSHNQSEELNKMHEVEGFTTSADVATNREADEMQVSWLTLEASFEKEDLDDISFNLDMDSTKHDSRLCHLPFKEQQASLQADNHEVSCDLDSKDDDCCTGLSSKATHLKGNLVGTMDHTQYGGQEHPATESLHQAQTSPSQHVYISSDEENGFVKVQKIVDASRLRRQRRAGCLNLVPAPMSASKASKGIQKQSQPNTKWRLLRKSQLYFL